MSFLLAFLSFLLTDWLAPLPSEKSYSTTVYARDSTLLASYLTGDEQWRMKTQPGEVSEDLVTALLAKEDRWFYYHPGINPLALIRAVGSNLFAGKRVSGASTITMQVARMLEPKPRTFGNKLLEMFRALQLEWHHSKEEILGMYLSYLPYGGNIEGVKAASYIYFDRPPASLSLSQSTLLTVIPNRPNSLRLDLFRDEAQRARDKWLLKFKEERTFPEQQVRAALDEPITAQRRNLPPSAPHLSRYLKAQHPQSNIYSTLAPEAQQTTERLLSNYIRRSRGKGVSNGAVLVVDNRNSEVLAYCGSADFNDHDASGQVDGVRAVRSPGSTLKPIAYAMALDKGLYTPDSRLLDLPTTWEGYSPVNYDQIFRGPISMAYALRHSLNIPAVQVLDEVGFYRFIDLMVQAGFASIFKQKEKLGLSVILGGCGVTLEELTRMFSTFARKGRLHPLRYQLDRPETKGIRLYSEASAWMIGDILAGIERPDLPNQAIEATDRPRISWKTGTSYGRRDAWSIGFTPRHTIGVWIGNFNGKGVPDLSGSTMAVPLLFDLFGALEQGLPRESLPRPRNVWQREICQETGDLPSDYCQFKSQGYYIREISPRQVCQQEQSIYVAPDSSIQFCTGCLPKSGYVKAGFPVLPASLTLWLESNNRTYRRPPPHNPDCEASFDGPGPEIISPSRDFEYLLEAGANQEILLQAASDTRVNRHYWYINGDFYRSCSPGEKIFFPGKRGKIKVHCMDDKGRSSNISIVVKEY